VQTSSVSGVDLPPASSASAPAFNAAQPAASFNPNQYAPAPVAAPAPAAAPAQDMSRFAGAFPVGSFETQPGTSFTPYQIDTTPPKGIIDTLTEKTGLNKETLARLGLAAGGSLYGAYQGKKAAEQGQAAKREQQALAEPYRAKGAELQRQAQAGELTPVGQ
jgi:hypothetical protein